MSQPNNAWNLTLAEARKLYDEGGKLKPALKHAARDAGLVLFIRWFASRTLRIDNYASMQLGVHLVRDSRDLWWQHYPKLYLKGARNSTREYHARVPEDVLEDLRFYLDVARPILLDFKTAESVTSHVFINLEGQPFTAQYLGDVYADWTFRVLGKRSTSHLVRHTNADFMRKNGFNSDQISDFLHNTSGTTRKWYLQSKTDLATEQFDAARKLEDKA